MSDRQIFGALALSTVFFQLALLEPVSMSLEKYDYEKLYA